MKFQKVVFVIFRLFMDKKVTRRNYLQFNSNSITWNHAIVQILSNNFTQEVNNSILRNHDNSHIIFIFYFSSGTINPLINGLWLVEWILLLFYHFSFCLHFRESPSTKSSIIWMNIDAQTLRPHQYMNEY